MTMSMKVLPRGTDVPMPPAEHRLSITGAFNLVLVESLTLYFNTRRTASFLSAPHLRAHFLILEDQARQVLRTADAVVERICDIDPLALGVIGAFAREGKVVGLPPRGPLRGMLMRIREHNLDLAVSLSAIGSDILGTGDVASINLINRGIEEAERRAELLFETARL